MRPKGRRGGLLASAEVSAGRQSLCRWQCEEGAVGGLFSCGKLAHAAEFVVWGKTAGFVGCAEFLRPQRWKRLMRRAKRKRPVGR